MGDSEKEEIRKALESMQGGNWLVLPEPMQVVREIEPGRVKVKAGTLEVDVGEDCTGTILVDGKRFPVQAMTIQLVVGQLPRVTVVFQPYRPDDTMHPAEEYHPEVIVDGRGSRHG